MYGNNILSCLISSPLIGKKEKEKALRRLLESNCKLDVNFTNNDGDSVLHVAVAGFIRNDVTKTSVKLLVYHGADANASNAKGEKTCQIAFNKGYPYLGEFLLFNEPLVSSCNTLIKKSLVIPSALPFEDNADKSLEITRFSSEQSHYESNLDKQDKEAYPECTSNPESELECPICVNKYRYSYSNIQICFHCNAHLCGNCWTIIMNTRDLKRRCPFCRKNLRKRQLKEIKVEEI